MIPAEFKEEVGGAPGRVQVLRNAVGSSLWICRDCGRCNAYERNGPVALRDEGARKAPLSIVAVPKWVAADVQPGIF